MGVGITGGKGFVALADHESSAAGPWSALTAAAALRVHVRPGEPVEPLPEQLVIPSQLIQALPYIVTIAAVGGLVGRVRPPAATDPLLRE